MRKQFVRPERSDLAGVEALAFRHLLIRDAAYEGLPKAARAEQHGWFAGWLEERAPEQHELAGYHLEQAHRFLRELGTADQRVDELAGRAARHLRVAGDGAHDRGDVPATVNLLTRAAGLLDDDKPTLVPLLLELAVALSEAGELGESFAVIERAQRIAVERSEATLVARVRVYRGWIGYWGHQDENQTGEVGRFAAESIPLFEHEDDLEGQAFAWSIIGSEAWSRCRTGDAEPAWRRAVELFDVAGDRRMADEYRGWLASVQVWGPTPCEEALANLRSTLAESSERPMAAMVIASAIATLQIMLGILGKPGRRSKQPTVSSANEVPSSYGPTTRRNWATWNSCPGTRRHRRRSSARG